MDFETYKDLLEKQKNAMTPECKEAIIEQIAKCDKVSFCVYDKGYKKEGDRALNIKSVVIFGRIRLVTDTEKAKEICTNICRKFIDDEEYIQKELNNALSRVQLLLSRIMLEYILYLKITYEEK